MYITKCANKIKELSTEFLVLQIAHVIKISCLPKGHSIAIKNKLIHKLQIRVPYNQIIASNDLNHGFKQVVLNGDGSAPMGRF